MSNEFDTLFPHDITGQITATITDLDDTPNHVIGMNEAWQIKVRWSLTSDNPTTSPLTLIAGTWQVTAFVEAVGVPAPHSAAFEGALPVTAALLMSASQPALTAQYGHWRTVLNVPANTITVAGIYKVTVMLTFLDSAGNTTDMVGFEECPLIAFHA